MGGWLRSYAGVQKENALGVLGEMGWKVWLPWNWRAYFYLRRVIKICDAALSG